MHTIVQTASTGKAYYTFSENGKSVSIINETGMKADFEIMPKVIELPHINKYIGIFKAYTNPSQTKLNIFGFWHKFFDNLPSTTFYGIRSRNGFQFTLHGTICINNIWYYFVITREHNRLYPLI